MGRIRPPLPSLLITAVTHSPAVEKEKIIRRLVEAYGETAAVSRSFDFVFTDYYEKEMGKGLSKFLAAYSRLETEDELPGKKLVSEGIEGEFLGPDGNRLVNIDPGFLSESRLVLASTKNFSHRIYLGRGVFGEVTLIYRHLGFHALEWTYPDFKSSEVQDFLHAARAEYVRILKGGN